ncbi:MAG: hypothetical protein R6V20_03430 [Desulfobia sp.]
MDYFIKKGFFFFSGLAVFLIFRAVPVSAAGSEETHHQVGILFFFFAVAYLLYQIYRQGYREEGWPEFRLFLWFIVVWCVFTITAGWLHGSVEPENFIRNAGGRVESLIVSNFGDVLYYLGRLNDLFLVPAFIFLLLAIRKWSGQG